MALKNSRPRPRQTLTAWIRRHLAKESADGSRQAHSRRNATRRTDDYIEWIKVEYFDRAEGHISDSGMTKIRQIKTIRSHLDNVPLASLDYSGVNRSFGYFRKRPFPGEVKSP